MLTRVKSASERISLDGFEVAFSNPDKVYFPQAGLTKWELWQYYLAVAPAVLRALARRPMVLKRYVNGAAGEPFFQKRAPAKRPDFVEVATFHYPSGRHAEEVVVNNRAALAWVVNLGCIEMHPHAVRSSDLERPDELRIDLDPVPGVAWPQILEVAKVAREVLGELGLVGWPKTSGSRGAHVWVRLEPQWPFAQVRRAAMALAQEIARRVPDLATAEWAKEQRHGVFIDYNQNARDRTTCAAWSVRATPDARVSMPLSWDEFLRCRPEDFDVRTVPRLFAQHGDAHQAIDSTAYRLDAVLELAARHKRIPASERSAQPVITIAQAKLKADVLDGLERWKHRHPNVAALLAPEDVLIDAQRGRATAWYRIRVNLRHVPVEMRPAPAPPDPDYDFRSEWKGWGP